MSRAIRIEYVDACYHVTSRGNDRRSIYRDDKDRKSFLETLEQCVDRFGIVVHGYCLMANHYHLLIQTPRSNLSRAMGWLQTTYSIRFNRRHRRVGHLFQGRYKAILVEADGYARQLIRYIHLNPVRPRDKRKAIPLNRRSELRDYRWSSHRSYSNLVQSPDWLCLDWLSYWGKRRKVAQATYRKEIRSCFGEVVSNPFVDLRGGLALTGEVVWEKVRDLIDHKQGQEELRWKRYEDDLCIRHKIQENVEIQSDRRLEIWARLRLGSERGVDLANEFGYRDGSGVLRVADRLETRARTDKTLAKKMTNIHKQLNMSIVKS